MRRRMARGDTYRLRECGDGQRERRRFERERRGVRESEGGEREKDGGRNG